MGLRDYTIYDFIDRNTALYPERDGIVFGDHRLNHRQIKIKCDQLAAGLFRSRCGKETGLAWWPTTAMSL